MRTLVLWMTFTLAVFGQRHKPPEDVDAEKPDGKLLQQVLQENDAAKKTALMEQFSEQFPKGQATPWVLEQLLAMYVKANQPDKILATGEKLLAVDPDDTEAALQNLKAAEVKKDLPQIKKWSATASANARKMIAAPQPKDAAEVDAWKNEVDYAKQVDTYTEYAIYRAGVESRDPKVTVEFLELLNQRNPQSEYVAKARDPLFLAYRQAGATDKAVALAERTLATDQNNEDMLLVVTDNYLQAKKEPEKVHAYSARLVQLMASKPKPEGASDADWTARRNLVTGLAHYMSGKLYYNETKFSQADQELRAALPLVEGNPAIKPEVLYLLGFANYKLERGQEAANYYRACAAIKSPFQALATKNLQGIKTQFTGIK